MTMVPDFIKKISVTTQADVFAFSGRSSKSFAPVEARKFVDVGGQDPGAGNVVLAILSKGVKSADDSIQAPALYLGSTAFVSVEEPVPLQIGVGGGQVETVDVEVPRFTRFTDNAKWG